MSRNKDDGDLHAGLCQLALEIESTHLRQSYVQNQTTGGTCELLSKKVLTSCKGLGAEANWLGSLQTPDNPFADSPWRKIEGALWDVGPHALAAVLPVLGPVRDIVGARGLGDLVHLVLTHESGATSTLHLSLTMPPAAARTSLEFYRADGWHAWPDPPVDNDVRAHRIAVGELIATARAGRTDHRCDARFGRDVVAVIDRAARVLSG